MSLADLIESLAERGVRLARGEGGRLLYRAPSGALSDALRAALARDKAGLLNLLDGFKGNPVLLYPLSYPQRSLWFLHQTAPGSTAYHLALAMRLLSPVDSAALRAAFQGILDRHAMLRTTYCMAAGVPFQRIHETMPLCWAEVDAAGLDDERLHQLIVRDHRRPIDLERGPLMRVTLYRRTASRAVLLVTIHHISVDGWSVRLMLEDLAALYEQARTGPLAPAAPPAHAYTDFVDWQRALLAGAEGERQWRYWRKQLAGTLPVLDLAPDHARPPVQTFNGGSVSLHLDEALTGQLLGLARRAQTTPFNVLLTGYLALLQHCTGQNELVVGTPSLGRSRAEFGGIVGDFINLLPLRVRLDPEETFGALLKRVRQLSHEALECPDYPFPLLVERLQPRRNPAWPPIVQTIFSFLSLGPAAELRRTRDPVGNTRAFRLAGMDAAPYPLEQQEGQMDLALELTDGVDTVSGVLRYNRDLYTEATVRRLAGHYVRLLQAAAADPEQPVCRLNRVLMAEEHLNNIDFTVEWCNTMTIARLVTELQKRDIKLWVEGERLRVNAPSGALTPELRETLARRKAELLDYLGSGVAAPTEVTLVPSPHSGPLPLSFGQQRLWFLDRMEPGNTAYHVPLALRFRGLLNQEAMERAINTLARRHETLRTTFDDPGGEPVQYVHEPRPITLPVDDLADQPPDTREAESTRRILAECQRPFDLRGGPLWRVRMLRLTPDHHILIVTMHHIISDIWSLTLFLREHGICYEALVAGKEPALEPLAVQYGDWASHQRRSLAGPALEHELAYWRAALDRAPMMLELPTDRQRPAIQSHRGAWLCFRLPPDLTARLHDLSRREGVTLFMTLLSAFGTLMMRTTGQTQVLVGSPVAGRTRRECEGMIGLFVNTIVLRVDGTGQPSFTGLLARMREVALAAYAHTELPFERLVEALAPQRDLSRSPIFQVMFALQTTGIQVSELAGLEIEPILIDKGTTGARYDLTLSMAERGGVIEASFEYNAGLFEEATIRRMIGHFTTLLESAADNPELPVHALPMLTAQERQALLAGAKATARPLEPVPPHARFELQAARRPAAVAVTLHEETLTYQDLNTRANRLAHCLIERGVGPDTLVAVCLERTPAMLVALLAIHKAGGAYLPLDPTYPTERLDYMIADSQAPLLLTQASLAGRLAEREGLSRLCLDTDWAAQVAARSAENPPARQGLDDLAYVIYTSGSTGRPKGVAVTQRGLTNFLCAMEHEPGLSAADTLLAVTTLCFDIAGLELWLPLCVGARIVLATREEAGNAESLIALLATSKATLLQATPATWRLLVGGGWPGNGHLRALCGGEALPSDLARELLERNVELWNMYGPTETTIWSAAHRVTAADLARPSIPLGHPIANTQLYVLDAQLELLPVGTPGELCIGGDGLARGYLGRPDLTAERFVEHPALGRLYRTGDLARRTSDGALEYLGRLDNQVKIRGHRIELGEIEATLAAHPGVGMAVVVAREDIPGDKRLAAYLVPRPGGPPLAVEALRAHLRATLPDYMTPAAFVFLEDLPLTPNGKVDRRNLPAPDTRRPELRQDFVAPASPSEQAIAAAWREVLCLAQIGVNENFFDLGGHSLLLLQVHDRLRRTLPRELSMVEIFQHPTIRALAAHVDQAGTGGLSWQRIQERAALQRAALSR